MERLQALKTKKEYDVSFNLATVQKLVAVQNELITSELVTKLGVVAGEKLEAVLGVDRDVRQRVIACHEAMLEKVAEPGAPDSKDKREQKMDVRQARIDDIIRMVERTDMDWGEVGEVTLRSLPHSPSRFVKERSRFHKRRDRLPLLHTVIFYVLITSIRKPIVRMCACPLQPSSVGRGDTFAKSMHAETLNICNVVVAVFSVPYRDNYIRLRPTR